MTFYDLKKKKATGLRKQQRNDEKGGNLNVTRNKFAGNEESESMQCNAKKKGNIEY